MALKSVYGDGRYINGDNRQSRASLTSTVAAAVDMAKETANRPTIRFCVDVYRAATFLDLHSNHFHQIIKQHLEGHLDQKLKWIFTRGNVRLKVKDEDTMLWMNDLIDGIREASKWDTKDIKLMVMEFIWVSRHYFLGSTWIGLERRLETVPGFIAAMHRHCAISPWRGRAVYAPTYTASDFCPGTASHLKCARCWTELPYKDPADPEAFGRLWDPFSLSADNAIRRQWCRKCAASDEIPWRTRKRPRSMDIR